MKNAVSLLFLINLLIPMSLSAVTSNLQNEYFAKQQKFRPCATLKFQTALNKDMTLPVGPTFFKNTSANSQLKVVHLEDQCNLRVCKDGIFQNDCSSVGVYEDFTQSTNTSLHCSCPVLIPDLEDQFNQSYTGVAYSPYSKDWKLNAKDHPEVAAWTEYPSEDIKTQLRIVAKSHSKISTYGMGATGPTVSWNQGDSSGLVAVAAAELNRELAAKGESTLSITQGIWHGKDQHPDIFAREVQNALEASEAANNIYNGTVTGLIFTSLELGAYPTSAQVIFSSLDAYRNETRRLGLKIGIRVGICHEIIPDDKLPESSRNPLHGVHRNYNYSEFRNPEIETIFKELIPRVDFIICDFKANSSLVNQPMKNVVETMGAIFVESRRILHTVNQDLTVIAQTGWPSWGNSKNLSPNNVSNLVQYWNLFDKWAAFNTFPLYMFEAFDEPWKNELNNLYDNGPNGPAGSEAFHGWWHRSENEDTVTYIPKIQDVVPEVVPSELNSIFIATAATMALVVGMIVTMGWLLRSAQTNIYNRYTIELAKDFRDGSKPSDDLDLELKTSQDESQVIALRFPYNRKYELPRNAFAYDEACVLGEGNSGIVYKGQIKGIPNPVAFKALKAEASLIDLKNLLSEIKIMSYVGRHEFIVNLLGAHTERIVKGEVYVASEFCEFGSLESYLKAQRGNYSSGIIASTPAKPPTNGYVVTNCQPKPEAYIVPSTPITQMDLLKWSYQIAAGLEHISLKKVIHADVACRNVLVSSNGTAKITDFGLSRQLYYKTQYLKSDSRDELPWRWMAVESLRSAHFSIQSDVWSFGITLWEIFSLIQLPYPGVMEWGEPFLLKLEENYRMLPPAYSTSELNNLMQRCWMKEPSERPSFTELKETLKELYQIATK